jgi:hypothetical protein
MQAAANHEAVKKKSESAPDKVKPAADTAVQVTELNPLWSSLATHVRGRSGTVTPDDPSPIRTKSLTSPRIQRLCTECEDESATESTLVQAKLTVGAPEDEYEREADAVADKVMRMPARTDAVDEQAEDAPTIQSKQAHLSSVQRLCAECEEELGQGGAPALQKKPHGSSSAAPVSASVTSVVNSPISGSPLSDSVRSRVEPVLGADLSSVRVHSGSLAQEASHSLNAKAFTHQNNIFLGRGQSATDLSLMAHEATHVMQQGALSPAATDQPGLQRQPAGPETEAESGTAANSAGAIGTTKGEALNPSVRQPFEHFFNTDLSNVQIATDGEANQSAQSLNARAYTHGNQVVFAAGEFKPQSREGQKLLAHELAHVVQQRRSPSNRINRQPSPSNNPILTTAEMFNIITRERAWTFNPGAAQMCVDPRGVGRGVGAAAGGRRAGSAVFTVMQVTDANGRPVQLSYGEHIRYGDPHAEQRAVSTLRRTIPIVRDVRGGRMTVVLDQIPCPPGRQNCMGLLQNFARERGLRLEIHVPTRQSMNSSRSVAPRTAAMSSMRTDTPPVTLERFHTSGTAPPGASSSGGGGSTSPPPTAGGTTGATGVTGAARGPIRLVGPTPATPSAIRAQASAIATLGRETQRSVRLTGRIRIIGRGVSGLLGVLGTIATLRSMQQMATHGTLFSGAEAQAERIGNQGREMKEWAISTTNNISLLQVMAAITDADERDDGPALFDIDESLTDIIEQFREKHEKIQDYAQNLRAREAALDVLVSFFGDLVSVPMGATTAPNADALAMHVSLQRLSGRVGSAADEFEAAENQLQFYIDYLESLAKAANSRAWAIWWENLSIYFAEMDREKKLNASIRRERRLNEIQIELNDIEAKLNEPVCRLPDYYDPLLVKRSILQIERDSLRAHTI